ncbi:MAG: addiction module protein [Ignavibacteriales bacterium]|jgi:putative addiction module component (TIGR02574 family)|nr:addiction module protein [Ignavibacteriales bacterium]RPI60031.1 MAG: addiction module protein [Ignavibacteriales bacterium]
MNDKLRTQINDLSVSEKILLVEEIWDSIASQEMSFDLNDSQKKIVKERSSSFKINPELGRSWEEIRNEFLGKNK